MTGPEWAAERVVDADLAAALVGAQFPVLRDAAVEPFAEGWDHTVHLVGGQWLFRFPRRQVALPGFGRELAVLPRLAGRLPLPVPDPELLGEPSGDFPWPFAGSRLVPGVELAVSGLPDDERVALGAEVGGFLRALHGTPLDGLAELPVDPLRRASVQVRGPQARTRLAALAETGLWEPDPATTAVLDHAQQLADPTGAPVLVHGDLHLRHLLVDEGRASGVIDWGDVCLADPCVDLSVAWSCFAGTARQALLDAYGPVDAERELRARVLALFLSAALAQYAHARGDGTLLAEALRGIGRAAG